MSRRMTALAAALACLLAALLWGCAADPAQESGPVLWFAGDVSDWDASASALDSLPYQGELTVDGLLDGLLAGPEESSGLTSPVPTGVRLLGWQLDGDGLLWVDLSEDYGDLTGISLTLADYCLTLTLSQLAAVERVSITVSGRPLSYRYRQELEPGQVVFSSAEEQPVEVSALLYFPRAAGRGLGFESRVFSLTEDDVLLEAVAAALLAGPESEGLSSAMPAGTELLDLRLEDGVCLLDLSQPFLDGVPADEEGQALLIYSIVNTLGNLDTVDAVCFLVEGTPLSAYGSLPLSGPLEPDFGLVGDD